MNPHPATLREWIKKNSDKPDPKLINKIISRSPRSNYKLGCFNNSSDYVYIEDLDQRDTEDKPFKSVTHDAEGVCSELNSLYTQGVFNEETEEFEIHERSEDLKRKIKIYYKDTEGNVDEMVHDNGVFIRFHSNPFNIK